ncbi:MAG: FAD-dependent monooxygenase [Bacteroidota bacterium]
MSPRTAAIIGGGIGGLSTAIALRQIGIEATVYERAPVLGEAGAGISLWPNATRALRQLGVLDRVLDTAGPIAALSVRHPVGRTLLRAPIDTTDAPAVCVYRPHLIDALRSALPPEALRTGRPLAEVTGDGRLRFANGSKVDADLVVGADGIRSTVRRFVTGSDEAPVYRGYPVWRGIGPLPSSFVPGEIAETWGDGLRFGLLDVGDGRAYWYATASRPQGSDLPTAEARRQVVLDTFARWHAPIEEVVTSTPAEAVLYGDTFDLPPLRGWRRGRTVLIGDAAHPTTPNLGQGGGMAIEDAVALAVHLRRRPLDDALDAFERARYRRTARVTRESLWTGRLGQAHGPVARLRDLATRLTPGAAYARRSRWLFAYDATA